MDLKKSIRKAKRKQFIVIGAITVVSFAVLFVGFFVGMDKLSTKNYHTLLEVMEIRTNKSTCIYTLLTQNRYIIYTGLTQEFVTNLVPDEIEVTLTL